MNIPYLEERYARHASIQSIRAYLKDARAEARRAERVVGWLEMLAAQREAQIAAGTWPPPTDDAGAP